MRVQITACWRLLRVAAHVGTGLWMVALRFPRLSADQQGMQVQAWSMAMLRHLGIALQVCGQPPLGGPVLLVANHFSWLDIVVMHAARHCRFVSRSDVQAWPLVGTLATAAGTLYIQRSVRRDALRVVQQMTAALRARDVLAVFPEGTTGDGHTLLPFHANLLQAALAADAPVLPVGLRYVDAVSGVASAAPGYVGDDSLLQSLWRTVCAPPLRAVVRYGKPETAQGRGRREWGVQLREAVDALRQP